MVPPPRPGDRVVVRHRLPAGSSHPVTDVVGELVADGDELVVRRRDGALVRVARPDVLRLKVVPARAVASSDVREVEHAAALGWPGLEQAWHRGWLLRAGAGLTQRACSAVPLAGPHGDQLVLAGRTVLALERAATTGEERRVRDLHRVERTGARRDDPGLL